MPYYERRTQSGRLMEIDRYYATRDGRKISRGENVEESSDDQKSMNDVQAANRLRRNILANFDPAKGDMLVTFTLQGDASRRAMDAAWKKFAVKVKAEREKRGMEEMKFIKIPHCQSGRWHFHVIMSGGMELSELQQLWGRGNRVQASVLNDSDNYRGLCRYLLGIEKPRKGETEGNAKEQRAKFKRRWSCSRNLAKPVVKKREISQRTVMQMPKAPKGWRLLPEWVIGSDKFGSPYVHFECVIEDAAAEGTKKTAGISRERAGCSRIRAQDPSASD